MTDDTISRQAALKTIQDLYPGMPRINFGDNISNWQQKYRQYIECENAIRMLPTSERKGHWRGYNADNPDWLRTDGSPIFMSCSECNGTVLNNGSAHWNYCPSCGARMERE